MTTLDLLNQPAVTAVLTSLAIGAAYYAIGKAGSALEALGARRGVTALVIVGKRLEAIAYDGPKLKGQPGAPEPATAPPSAS